MKVYKTQDIRNVAILGHGGCGKTSLVEAMAHVTGVTNRQGRVEDGNTISDWAKAGVDKAAALGLIKGYEDGSFAPAKNIRRDESMVVIYRLLNLE